MGRVKAKKVLKNSKSKTTAKKTVVKSARKLKKIRSVDTKIPTKGKRGRKANPFSLTDCRKDSFEDAMLFEDLTENQPFWYSGKVLIKTEEMKTAQNDIHTNAVDISSPVPHRTVFVSKLTHVVPLKRVELLVRK